MCPDCGNSIEDCSDPERTWYPYRRICYAGMERTAAEAAYEALHKDAPYHDGTFTKWSRNRTRSHPYKYDDAVTVGVATKDVAKWDEFTTKVDASPEPPSPVDERPDVG